MTGAPAPHALIIEDEMIIALEVEHLLRGLGYGTVDVATTPGDALAHATRRRPDLITADVRILEGTGIEAVKAITDRLGEIPYFYVTGNVDLVAQEGHPVVEKPIDERRFRRACAAVVGSAA